MRVLSAEDAAGADADYLFVVGLGEGSFPDLSPPRSLLDDADRDRAARIWRWAGRRSVARDARPPFQ